MKAFTAITILLLAASASAGAQSVTVSSGEVSRRSGRADVARLVDRIPGLDAGQRTRVLVAGDSAQRIAMADYDWNGRVNSVEIDEEDSRLFWDVKIVPDSDSRTIVRYRIDAVTGGILSIKEFTGIRGLARRP